MPSETGCLSGRKLYRLPDIYYHCGRSGEVLTKYKSFGNFIFGRDSIETKSRPELRDLPNAAQEVATSATLAQRRTGTSNLKRIIASTSVCTYA